jgi:hypothetical protein
MLPPGVRLLFDWLGSSGHRVDIRALHDQFPQVGWHTYEAWARTQLARFRKLCQHPEPVAS